MLFWWVLTAKLYKFQQFVLLKSIYSLTILDFLEFIVGGFVAAIWIFVASFTRLWVSGDEITWVSLLLKLLEVVGS